MKKVIPIYKHILAAEKYDRRINKNCQKYMYFIRIKFCRGSGKKNNVRPLTLKEFVLVILNEWW